MVKKRVHIGHLVVSLSFFGVRVGLLNVVNRKGEE